MMIWRRALLLLIAIGGAIVVLRVLLRGAFCLVPSAPIHAGELGTAETSIYGLVLYRESGTDHDTMYKQAVWWYELMLFACWGAAVATGVLLYFAAGWIRSPKPTNATSK